MSISYILVIMFDFYIIYIMIAINYVYINTMAVLTKKNGVIYLIKLIFGSKKQKKKFICKSND